jgi:hypothetical protein
MRPINLLNGMARHHKLNPALVNPHVYAGTLGRFTASESKRDVGK